MKEKHESDLTRKEKWDLERKKIRNLGVRDGIVYLWTYYRFVLVIILAVILVGAAVVTAVGKSMEKQIFSLAIVDAEYTTDTGALSEELQDVLGTGERHETVSVDAGASSEEGSENEAKLTIVMSVVAETDAVVCNREVYERFAAEGIFADWRELLGEQYEDYQFCMTDDGMIDISRCPGWQEREYTDYEPAYLCVLDRSEHKEEAVRFAEYFAGIVRE